MIKERFDAATPITLEQLSALCEAVQPRRNLPAKLPTWPKAKAVPLRPWGTCWGTFRKVTAKRKASISIASASAPRCTTPMARQPRKPRALGG